MCAIRLRHDDERLAWRGVISLERSAEWTMPWRIPHGDRALYAPVLAERASSAAGVRISFVSDTASLAVGMEPFAEDGYLDLCVDGRLAGSASLVGGDLVRFDGLPAEPKLIELWLPPQYAPFRLRWLGLDAGATVEAAVDQRPRWITYGSSITHCRTAGSPTQTWPAIVARDLGLNLTCLGYGGNCHLDPLIARIIRDQPADYVSMCVGINIHGSASLNERTFRWGIIAFAQIIRETHPGIPLAIMSPITSPPRETAPNAVGMTLRDMRREVAEAVRLLREHGDEHVHYVHGPDAFGADLAHRLPDDLHPDAEGYRIMGRNLTGILGAVFRRQAGSRRGNG